MPYIGTWLRAFDFLGRSTRAEYWTFYLINLVIAWVAAFLVGEWVYLFVLLALVPLLAVTVRRHRDALGSGFWIFLAFIPFVGALIVFIILPLIPSRPLLHAYPEDWHTYSGTGTAVDRTQSWGSDSAGTGGNDPWDQR